VDILNFVLEGMSSYLGFLEVFFSSLLNFQVILDVILETLRDIISFVEINFSPFGDPDVIIGEFKVIPDIVSLLIVNQSLFWICLFVDVKNLFTDVLKFLFVLHGVLDEVLNLTSNFDYVSVDSLLSFLVNLVQRSNSVFWLSFFGIVNML
jgi:hypothetical protein